MMGYTLDMDTIVPHLPPEIEDAVAAQHGGPIAVSGGRGAHVVMSLDVFRDMMGVGNDVDFADSVADLNLSLQQAEAGQTMTLDEAAKKLIDKYGV